MENSDNSHETTVREPLPAHKIHVTSQSDQPSLRPLQPNVSENEITSETEQVSIENMPEIVSDEPKSYSAPMNETVASHLYGTVPAAVQAAKGQIQSVPMPNTPGIIVLQWLTYAFWGWTVMSVIWLIYIVIANFILGTDLSTLVPYAIAATLVLLPLSFVCDLFYSRRETSKKTGAAVVVMVIHAVIFALFGIGILIFAVFLVVQMSIGTSTDNSTSITLLTTLFISAVIYGSTFLRTLNPTPHLRVGHIYRIGMLVTVAVFIVLAFVGPVAKSVATKDDRDIASGLDSVSYAIRSYVRENNELPDSLNSVSLDGTAADIVNRGLVKYTKEDSSAVSKSGDNSDEYSASRYTITFHRYQLCVNYKQKDSSRDSNSYPYSYADETNSEYSNILSTYNHPAGAVCYKVENSSKAPMATTQSSAVQLDDYATVQKQLMACNVVSIQQVATQTGDTNAIKVDLEDPIDRSILGVTASGKVSTLWLSDIYTDSLAKDVTLTGKSCGAVASKLQV